MKYLTTILLFIIAGYTAIGTFVIGFSLPESTGISGEFSNGRMIACSVYIGESRECTEADKSFIISLKSLYEESN